MRGKLTEKVILLQKNLDRGFMRGLNKYKFNGTCVWTL